VPRIPPPSVTRSAWALALHDPQDEWEVKIFSKDSTPARYPEVQISVDQGFVMTGGGAQAHWSAKGSLLTASRPVGSDTWEARSKDHVQRETDTLTVYAIGVRPRNGAPNVAWKKEEATSDVAPHPSVAAHVQNGWQLVGGGAFVDWQGAGNLLTASYPQEGSAWEASSKDHLESSPARITAYAIGVRPPPQAALQMRLPGFVHTTPNEEGWRWCNKCQGLIFAASRVGVGHDRGGQQPCPGRWAPRSCWQRPLSAGVRSARAAWAR
jgi:hypothetical protein